MISIGTPHIAAISMRSHTGKRMKRSLLYTRAPRSRKARQILEPRGSPTRVEARGFGDAASLNAGCAKLRQDHFAMVDLFFDA